MTNKILFTFLTKLIKVGVSFLLLALTAKYLGATGRGQISIVVTSVNLITLFSGFLGGSSLIYLLPQNKRKKILWFSLTFLILWNLIIAFSVTQMLRYFKVVDVDLVNYIFLIGFLNSILISLSNIVYSGGYIKEGNVFVLAPVCLLFILFCLIKCIFKEISVYHYMTSWSAAMIVSTFWVLFFIVRISSRSFKENGTLKDFLKFLKDMWKFGVILQLGNLIQYINYRFSFYLINYYTNAKELGVYSVAIAIAEGIWLLADSIGLVLYIEVANMLHAKNAVKITIVYAKFGVFFSALMSLMILALPKDFFVFIFGQDFSQIKQLFVILIPGTVVFSLNIVVSHYFAGKGNFKINTFVAFIGLLVTIILNYFLIPIYGNVGAAVSTDITYFLMTTLSVIIFTRNSKHKFNELWSIREDEIKYFLTTFRKNIIAR